MSSPPTGIPDLKSLYCVNNDLIVTKADKCCSKFAVEQLIMSANGTKSSRYLACANAPLAPSMAPSSGPSR